MQCDECRRMNCVACEGERCTCSSCLGRGRRYLTRCIDITFDTDHPGRWIDDVENGLLDYLTQTQLEDLATRAGRLARDLAKEAREARHG